ncbi:hypothetical protein IJE86_07825 [bacterium]|nr:hypothetical protein [bacterium]
MEILKYPDVDNKVVCYNCGCEFIFMVEDIKLSDPVIIDGGNGECSLFYQNYVECPICKVKHTISFDLDEVCDEDLDEEY